jgi:activator of HSP90 ATPase
LKKIEVTTIKQKVIIPKVSPKQVYGVYVDPKKHSEFTGSKATGKPEVGGKFTAWDGYIFGKYLELEVEKRVVQDWATTDWKEGYPASKLELTFYEIPQGTKIVMMHSNVPKSQTIEIKQGWKEFYWDPLKRYFNKNLTES